MQASPSKARAEALEAHSWSLVHAWLSDLYYPSPVPSVERNAATLKALQGLMAENLAADQIWALVSAAQREELAAAGRSHSHVHAPRRPGATTGTGKSSQAEALLQSLESSLPPLSRPALDSLAESAVLLGCPATGSASIVQGLRTEILALARQTAECETQISSIDALVADLNRQISQVQRTISDFPGRTTAAAAAVSTTSSSSFPSNAPDPSPSTHPASALGRGPASGLGSVLTSTPESLSSSPVTARTTDDSLMLHAQTLQHQRETKQLALKCNEYRDRIGALERRAAARPSPSRGDFVSTISQLAAKQDLLRRKTETIETFEAKIRAFHGLPPDLDASRSEIHRAQAELDALSRRRDALFEQMGV